MKTRLLLLMTGILISITLMGCQSKDQDPLIFVDKIEGLNEQFLKGVDASSVLALEKSGVVFKNSKGKEQDIFKTFKEAGINSIRLRVWNDPYDENGNGYGGGTNDLATTIELGKRGTTYDHSILIDFHYSDFWADPSKQQAPKAWQSLSYEDKVEAIYTYTKESVTQLLEEDINVTMVQIGNETTNGFCGESNWKAIAGLFDSASKAIREVSDTYDKEILIGVHFTNPEKAGSYERYAMILDNFNVDYDVFISSYYPFWHGSLENLQSVLTTVSEKYNKKVMVGEVSYAYTYDNGDGQTNTITEESVFERVEAISVQGQANVIADVIKTVSDIDQGIGVYYWEPAWIPVPTQDYEQQKVLWEEFGSGWATSYASDYDPEDAGLWYGGTSWDNQGLFDFTGMPLPSLDVFRLIETGATTEVRIDEIQNGEVRLKKGHDIELPQEVHVIYNNGESKTALVTWNEYDTSINEVAGIYEVTGLVNETKQEVRCKVVVMEPNYIENPSFEDEDISMWTLNNKDNLTTEVGVLEKATDARTDFHSFHFYSTDKVDFSLEQEISDIKSGQYNLNLFIQGGDVNNGVMTLYAIVDDQKYEVDMIVDGWVNWQNPTIENIPVNNGSITIGVSIQCDPGGWGSIDDVSLFPVE